MLLNPHLNRLVTLIFLLNAFAVYSVKAQAQAQDETYTIAGISVEGNKFSDAETIIVLSGLKPGDQITLPADNKLAAAIRNLWKRKQFEDVRIDVDKITPAGLFLKIVVKEFQRLSEVAVKNNKELSLEDINKAIDKHRGDIISNYDIYLAKSRVKKAYDKEGFLFAKIETALIPTDTNFYSKLALNIEEGIEFKVRSIDFEGNTAYTDGDLRGEFEDTEEKTWWKFWSSAKFDKIKYEKDKELLVKFYRTNGYIDASLIKDTVLFNPDDETVDIKLNLYEGNKYYLRNIEFRGNTIYPTPILIRRLDLQSGEVYDMEKFETNLRHNEEQTDVSSIYLNNGYLTANFDKEERRIGKDSVDIIIKVYEGNRFSIGRVEIIGNNKTKDKVIRRELYTRPGDYFDRSAIIKSVRALGLLNYFNPEKLKPDIKFTPSDNTKVDVVYQVEEQSTDTFNMQIGYAGAMGFMGAIGFTFNNFSITEPFSGGGGQIFNFNWDFGDLSKYQTFSLGFTEPWLFDEPTTVGFNIFHSKINYSYSLTRTGLSMNLGRRFKWPDDYFRGDLNLRFQRNDVGTGGSIYWRPGINTEIAVGASVSRISLNSMFFPSWGSKFSYSVNVALGALGIGTTDYIKNEFVFDLYNPLMQIDGNDRMVLYLGTKWGYITGFKSDTTISPIELYYMGGNGLSGFGVTPLRGYDDQKVGSSSGSKVLSRYIAELRFAISLNPMPIYLYGFAEAGNVWQNFGTTDPFNLKRSAGVGVQLFINPIGVVGFSYGYGFDKDITGNVSGWKFLIHLGGQ